MTKKGRQFFQEKNRGWHHQLPPRVTPTLVTPLRECILTYLLTALYCDCVSDVDCAAVRGAGYSRSSWSTMRYYHATGFCLQLALTTSVSVLYRPAVILTLIATTLTLFVAAHGTQCSVQL